MSRKSKNDEGGLPLLSTADSQEHIDFEINAQSEKGGRDPDADLAINSSEEEEDPASPEHQHLEPVGSTLSSNSINAKPTTATLAETDSGSSSPEERDDQEESLFGGTYYPPEYQNENDQGYTEFDGGTIEEDDLDTLDYTAADNEIYDGEYPQTGDYDGEGDESQTEFDETTCSRTLNTNLEGINYVAGYEHQAYVRHHGQVMPNPYGYGNNTNYMQQIDDVDDGQYYYEDEAYDQFPVDAYTGQGYYDENGDFVRQYQEGTHFYDMNELANSSIETEGIDVETERKGVSIEGKIDESPLESYESEDSNSSWDDEETRDMSLLDGSQDEETDQADTSDDEEEESDDDDESSSDDDSRSHRRGGRRRRRHRRRNNNNKVLKLLKEMKNCSSKSGGISYDDDEVPGVAQLSSGATSGSTSSYDRKQRKSGRKQRRSKKYNRDIDNLFSKVTAQVSAMGLELFDPDNSDDDRRRSRKKKSRRKNDDPATRLVESFKDLFSCGSSSYY